MEWRRRRGCHLPQLRTNEVERGTPEAEEEAALVIERIVPRSGWSGWEAEEARPPRDTTQTKQATENDDDDDETFTRQDPEAKLFGKTGSTSWWCF